MLEIPVFCHFGEIVIVTLNIDLAIVFFQVIIKFTFGFHNAFKRPKSFEVSFANIGYKAMGRLGNTA
ncbi:Uncharacterised protein [Mycobacterium tuberculosis]|nr:Uncharacterised protein [Mycobacterium tuberculosis]